MYKVFVTKNAAKDFPKLTALHIDKKVKALIEVLKNNPYQTPPSNEKLVGDLNGLYSRRINLKRRLVYEIDDKNKIVKIVSVWSHYEEN